MAAAQALADGLDSPGLRSLAGAPRAAADEEATELGPRVVEELGLPVAPRLSSPAVVDGARLRAARFVADPAADPRALTHELWHASIAADHPDALAEWSGFDDWYDMVDAGVIAGDRSEVDAAVREAASGLAAGRTTRGVDLAALFVERGPA